MVTELALADADKETFFPEGIIKSSPGTGVIPPQVEAVAQLPLVVAVSVTAKLLIENNKQKPIIIFFMVLVVELVSTPEVVV